MNISFNKRELCVKQSLVFKNLQKSLSLTFCAGRPHLRLKRRTTSNLIKMHLIRCLLRFMAGQDWKVLVHVARRTTHRSPLYRRWKRLPSWRLETICMTKAFSLKMFRFWHLGDHLPTPPPIPGKLNDLWRLKIASLSAVAKNNLSTFTVEIQRALEYLASLPATTENPERRF